MVHRQEQEVSRVAQFQKTRPDQTASGHVKELVCLFVGNSHLFSLTIMFGQGCQIGHGQPIIRGRCHDLNGCAILCREGGAQNFVPPQNLPDTPLESIDVQGSCQIHGHGNVRRGMIGQQLFEEPQSLLAEREGSRAVVIARLNDGGLGDNVFLKFLLQQRPLRRRQIRQPPVQLHVVLVLGHVSTRLHIHRACNCVFSART